MNASKVPVLIIAAALAVTLGACENEENRGIGVSVDQIVNDPQAFYGSTVTVSGEVNDVHNETTFTIGGGEFDEELLVLSLDSIAAVAGRTAEEPVRARDIVQVTGQVRQFASGDFSDEFGLDMGAVDDEFEDRPVLIARSGSAQLPSLVVTPRGGPVAPPSEEEIVTDFTAAAAQDARGLTGQMARFTDIRVAKMVGDQSFWATSGGGDSLFVSLTSGAVESGVNGALDTTQTWKVYGVLRDVPTQTELGAAWNIDEATISRLSDESVFLQAILARRSASM